jgi:K+-sensing histidine kinase KdpD
MPHSCETFNNVNPGICTGCPSRGKITNPLALGKIFKIAVEEPIKPLDQSMSVKTIEHIKEHAEVVTRGLSSLPEALYPFVYGKEGGETRVRFYDMDDNVLIEIADNGLGIAKEHLPRLFERFYRVDKSRSRNEGGSGLGLAICKHIVDSHNQSISVRSTEGVGSTFAFTLRKVAS